jgi:hypothetical protein
MVIKDARIQGVLGGAGEEGLVAAVLRAAPLYFV